MGIGEMDLVDQKIKEIKSKIDTLKRAKDLCFSKADYELAASIRGQIDAQQQKLQRLKKRTYQSYGVAARRLRDEKPETKTAVVMKSLANSLSPDAPAVPKRVSEAEVKMVEGIHNAKQVSGEQSEPYFNSREITQMSKAYSRSREALGKIIHLTNPETPGIYEADRIEEINVLAREAQRLTPHSADKWSHNQPKTMGVLCIGSPVPTSDGRLIAAPKGWEVIRGTKSIYVLATEALEKLSGDLSHNNVATAKQILKRIVG